MSACGTTTFVLQQYAGEPRPSEQVAILRINGGQGPDLLALDEKPLKYQVTDKHTRVHIEMLPGVHQVSIANPAELGRPVVVRFKADPDRVYRALIASAPQLTRDVISMPMSRPAVFEVSRDSDAPVRDVSLPERPLAPKAPPPALMPPGAPGQPPAAQPRQPAPAPPPASDAAPDAKPPAAPPSEGPAPAPDAPAPAPTTSAAPPTAPAPTPPTPAPTAPAPSAPTPPSR